MLPWNCIFETVDGCQKRVILPDPLPSHYRFPIYSPRTYKWMNPEVLVPNKVLGNYREYELYTRDYKYSNAVYKEVWHECGTEAAVERALIKQKNEFNSYFKKFYNQIFGVDSDLKSESISEHIWGNLDCFCQWCAAMRNDKNCHTKDGSMPF